MSSCGMDGNSQSSASSTRKCSKERKLAKGAANSDLPNGFPEILSSSSEVQDESEKGSISSWEPEISSTTSMVGIDKIL